MKEKIYKNNFAKTVLNNLPFVRLLPIAVVHWFLILTWAVLWTVFFIGLSFFSFAKIDGEALYKYELQKQTASIKKKDLEDILLIYKAKENRFKQIKHQTFEIKDPSI